MEYEKDGFAFCMDGFGFSEKCFAKQSCRFSSLFSLLSSPEKAAMKAAFSFGGPGGIRTLDLRVANAALSRETRLHTPKSRCQNRFALRLFMILTFLARSRRILFRHSRGKNPRARTAKIRLSPVKSLNHIDGKAFHTGLAVLFRGCILQLFSVRFRFSPFVRHLSAVAHSFFIYDA